jgi:peptidoglycan glycosyltransferase
MNKPIYALYVVVLILFALLVAFTSRWTVFEADALRDNPLNQRTLLETLKIPRGAIRAADGQVLARSRPVGHGELRTYTRVYPPAANPFAHVLGYSFARTGQAGLERERNDELTGKTGDVATVFDQLTGKQRVGNDLLTTLDPKAQQAAVNGLAGRKGAVVALDPRTGAVKAMASFPGYAPDALRSPSKKRQLDSDNTGSPLFNRATQSAYSPGSTFKVVTAIAALDSGRFTTGSTLSGKSPKNISGVPLSNFNNEQFGIIDLTTALTHSVNTVWAQVAVDVGKPKMAKTMEALGFNREPPLDYPSSQMRPSGEYRNGRLLSPLSRFVDTGRMGIGQDKLQVTPMQMAMVASAVANGGRLMEPHITNRVVDRDGRTVDRTGTHLMSQAMKPETANSVGQMMASVVKEGTGTAAALQGIDVAGKTGTAEVGSCPSGNQVSFIGFAPVKDPRIAVAVTVECAPGQGGTVAAPIAKQVMESVLKP